jgi:TP901 family phage tail tape measure protein
MADDVKVGVKFDEEAFKKSGKKLKEQLERMEKRLSRKRARNRLKRIREEKRAEQRITRDQMREQVKRERMERRLSRKRARNRLKEIKARRREEARIQREAERERERRRDRRRAIAGGAVRGAGRAAGFGLGFIGATTGALFDAEQALEFGRSLAILAGQAGISEDAQMKLGQTLTDTSVKFGILRTEALRGFEAVIEKSGNFELATQVIDNMAQAAVGLGADMTDLGQLAAALNVSFGAGAGEIKKFFDVLTAQGDKGQITLKDFARIGEEVFGTAAGFGIRGATGVNALSALIQSSVGTADERKTALNSLLSEFVAKKSKIQKKTGISTLDKAGNVKDPAQLVKDIIKATKGDISVLSSLFSGTAIKPFLLSAQQFRETGKFTDLDKFLGAGAGAQGLVERRFKRVEATAGIVALEKLQGVIVALSDSALAPALNELSTTLSDLLKDKEKVRALTDLFKTLGEGFGLLIEAAAVAGSGIGFLSRKGGEIEKKTGVQPTLPFSPAFGVKAFKSVKDFFSKDSKGPSGLSVQNEITVDDRGNVKKQRTRVMNQNNSNVGRTLQGMR